MVETKKCEALEERLVCAYNKAKRCFDNIPPGYDAPLPMAKIKSRCEEEEVFRGVTFEFKDSMVFK